MINPATLSLRSSLVVLAFNFLTGTSFAQTQPCNVEAFANYYDLVCGDTLRLDAIGSGNLAFRNNFNCLQVQCPQGDPTKPTDNFGFWSNSSSAQFDNPCDPQHPSGTPYIWFNQNTPSPRILATQALPLATGGIIKFDMRFADPYMMENEPPCENPDEADEGVHLQYSIDNGARWNDISYYDPDGGYDPRLVRWNSYIIRIPDAAETNSTLIRWAQLSNTGEAGAYLDHWGLDNLEIIANPPNSFYKWSHETITRDVGEATPFVPLTTSQYIVTYYDGTNSCKDTVNIDVKQPTIAIAKNPIGPVCPQTPVQITAVSSLANPNFVCGISPTGCRGSKLVIPVGIDSLTNTNYYFFGKDPGAQALPCVNNQSNFVNTARTQFIVRANEINSTFKKGQVNRLYFYSPQQVRAYVFRIQVGCTSKNQYASATAGEFVGNMSEVYFRQRVDFYKGWNVFTFDSAYDWDGTSNLAIQICFNGSGPIIGNLYKSNSGFNSVLHAESCTADANACDNVLGITMDSFRPTIRIGACYRPDPDLSYVWTPPTGLNKDTIPTPIAKVSNNSTFTLTVWDRATPYFCAVKDSISIQMNQIGLLDAQYSPICGSGPLDLKGILSNPPAGTTYKWTGPGGYSSNQQNPTRDPAVEGWYFFEATSGTCKGIDSIQVKIDSLPRAGTDYAATICATENKYDLFAGLTGNPHTTGTWKAIGTPSGSAGLAGGILNATGLTVIPGTYVFEYTVDFNNSCGPKKSTATITINKQSFAGVDSTLSACNSGNKILLFNQLKQGSGGKNPDTGGTWTEDGLNSAGAKFNASTGELDLNQLAANSYRFRYIVSSATPCLDDTAYVTVNVNNQPDAGQNTNLELCFGASVNLFSKLGGSPSSGGTWKKNGNFAGTLDPVTGDFTASPLLTDTGSIAFTYLITAIAPCKADSAIVNLKVNGYPQISSPVATCAADKSSFSVSFNVSGGDAFSYSVDKSGAFSGTSPRIFTSQAQTNNVTSRFVVSDAKGCRADTLYISKDCSCETSAGTMSQTPQNLCPADQSSNSYQGGFNDDGNDVSAYYLHQGNGSTLINVLDSNTTGIFSFKSGMVYGQTYYISNVAGNNQNGFPSHSDPCFTVAPGTPVVWNQAPGGSISVVNANICPGDSAELRFTASSGKAPFTIKISDGSTTLTFTFLTATSGCYVHPLVTTDYTLLDITDANACQSVINGTPVRVNINTAPQANLKPSIGCSDGAASLGELQIDLSGAGTSYTVWISNSLNTNIDVVSGLSKPFAKWQPSHFDPNQAITYTIDSVSDNSGSVCPGVVSGYVTIDPIPTAQISGSGVYCQGTQYWIHFATSGLGPWILTYSDGTNQFNRTLQSKSDSVAFTASQTGNYSYTLVSVVDKNGNGCQGTVSGQAIVQVNGAPKAALYIEDPVSNNRLVNDSYCFNSGTRNLVVAMDPNFGSGNTFNVTYTTNGINPQTVTVSRPELIIPLVSPAGTLRNYVITNVSDTSAASCPGTGSAASVRVNPLPFVNIIGGPQQVCLGDTADLTLSVGGNGPMNFTVTGSGADVDSYPVSENAGTTVVRVIPDQTGTATYTIGSITDSSNPGCSSTSSTTFSLNVNALPTAGFPVSAYEICEGAVLKLDYALSGVGPIIATYNGAGSLKPHTKQQGGTYFDNWNNLLPGTYTFTFTDVKDAVCIGKPGAFTTVVVRAKPQVALSLSTNVVCLGDPVSLTMNVSGNPKFELTYTDEFLTSYPVEKDIVNSRTVTVPSDKNRTFKVKLITDGSNPDGLPTYCENQNPNASISLIVHPLPEGTLSGTDEICQGDTASIAIDLNGNAPFTVSFDQVDKNGIKVPVNTSFGSTGIHVSTISPSPIDSIEYTTLKITDTYGCKNDGSGTAYINVNPTPAPQFTVDPPAGCSPLIVTLTNLPEGSYQIGSQLWNFGDGSAVNSSVGSSQIHTYVDQSIFPVKLTVISAQGCEGSLTKQVTVYPDPIADFNWTPDLVTIQDNQVRFNNLSFGGSTYSWDFGTGKSSDSFAPIYSYPGDPETRYPVCLITSSGFGCKDTLCKDLFVKGMTLVNIPNSFTPNEDGYNETWKPVVLGVRPDFYELSIFDRWGQVIWETRNPEEGWDGLDKQHELCKQDVYVFRLSAKSEYSADKIVKTGNLSLIR